MDKIKIGRVVVVGAGEAGRSFLEALKASGRKITATLIDKNDFYFPKNKINKSLYGLEQIKKTGQWADKLGIDFISAKVEKVSEIGKKIYLDNSKKLEFKNLIVATGALDKKIDIKGKQKEGFFYLSEVNPGALKTLLKIHNEAVIFAATLEGLKFSLFLRSLQKEVRIISNDLEFLGRRKEKIINILEKKGVIIHLGYSLEEAIGEKSIKAVKIRKKEDDSLLEEDKIAMKVFSSQLVFADSGLKPNLGFLTGQQADLEKKDFFTKFGQIYIIGDAGNSKIERQKFYLGNRLKAEKEGKLLADYLLRAN